MIPKEIFNQLNISAQCKKYGISLWQCPHFLFLVMGIVIIGAILAILIIGLWYIEDPEQVALAVIFLAFILFIIDFIITRTFEKIAEISRMKTEFINIVSHQMRTPLTRLNWILDSFMSGELGKIEKKQKSYLEILKENSARIQKLVSDLLIVSRIEEERLVLRKQNFSLKDLAKDLILKFKPFAKASDVEIKFETPKDLPQIHSNRDQIQLVIEKLLDNAIRYNKRKGKVRLKLEKKDPNFYFEIQDTGVGVPRDDQKYIFQKLFRSENILRYHTQGSGLGLYIAKSIIEKLGGKIGFESEEGKGSTFWFTIPIEP